MPNPYAKPRTQGHEGHSSKPSVFYGMPGETQRYMHRGPAGHTRRQHALYPGQREPHVMLGDKSRKAHGKIGGTRRRGRKTRSTRRR